MKPATKARIRAKARRWSPNLVKELRREHKLSQTALAKLVGVGLNTVYLWEKGLTHPRTGVQVKVLNLTKATAEDVRRLLWKAGMKVGMKKPGRKPKVAGKAGAAAKAKPARGKARARKAK